MRKMTSAAYSPKRPRSPSPARMFGAALVFFASLGVLAAPARAAQQLWAAAYVDWTFASEAPGIAIAQDMWVPQPATASFFTLNWDFVAGDGGYIGLQSDEAGVGNARFSLWNADASQGAACRRFDGEGEGMTCVTPLPIAPDKIYRVHVTRGEADARGQWWIGWIETRGEPRRQIGALRVARTSTAIAPASVHDFSEFWGDAVAACRAVPLSAAAFGPPTLSYANGAKALGGGATGRRPDGHRCRSGRERSGATAGHTPLTVGDHPGMMITLGGDAESNRTLAQSLAVQSRAVPRVHAPQR